MGRGQTDNGMRLVIQPEARNRLGVWLCPFLVWLCLFLALIGAAWSMLDLTAWPGAVSVPHAFDGVRLMCNRLFAISESRQLYVYDRLPVHAAEVFWDGALGAGLLVCSAVLAAFCGAVVLAKNRVVTAATVALLVCVLIYFGVFPSFVWSVGLFASLALAVLWTGGARMSGAAGFFVLIVLAAALGAFAYPGVSPALYTASESLRDVFDEKIESPAAESLRQYEERRQAQMREERLQAEAVGAAENDQRMGQGFALWQDDIFAGAQVGSVSPRAAWIAALTAVVLVLLLLLWLALALRAAAQRRALLRAAECNLAVRYMFLYAMDCLYAMGLRRRNALYADCAADVAAVLSPGCAEAFCQAARLWGEAVYSAHAMTEDAREQMQGFLDMLCTEAKRKSVSVRLRLMWVRLNGGGL